MNILVLTPIVPYPPHDGDKLRLYHFLKYLKSKGHKIDLFCVSRVRSDFQYAEQLRPLCRHMEFHSISNFELFFNLLGGLLMGQSLNVASHFSPPLRDSLKAYWRGPKGKSIDVVLAHRLRMAPTAFEDNPGKPVVMDFTDSLTSYFGQLRGMSGARLTRRLAAWWDYWFIRREEVEWGEKAFQSLLISDFDAQVLREQGLYEDKVTVIPNGVESIKVGRTPKGGLYPKGRPVVCFVGNMGYAANEDGALWFLNKMWPQVKESVPDAVFAAVGGNPRKVLQKYHNGKDVLVTGWVPQIEPYVAQATVTIAPLRIAAGMQNKVGLALQMGVPVVATAQAVAWLPPAGREGVIVAGGEDLFAREVAEALWDPKKARAVARVGRRFVLNHYRWKDSGRKLEQTLQKAVKAAKASRLSFDTEPGLLEGLEV